MPGECSLHQSRPPNNIRKRQTITSLPRHEAGYEEIVRLLLAYNAKTGIVDSNGNTALSLASLEISMTWLPC